MGFGASEDRCSGQDIPTKAPLQLRGQVPETLWVSGVYGDSQAETGRVVVRESLQSFRDVVKSHPSEDDRLSHTDLEEQGWGRQR